ncbi:MAG: hypothetical protein ACI9G1_000384, partial [Pirellulaceae bacterium]
MGSACPSENEKRRRYQRRLFRVMHSTSSCRVLEMNDFS